MNDEHTIDSPRVTLGDDGVYRWLYRMNMEENKSMLYMLWKIFAWIGAGAFACWAVLLFMNHNTDILFSSFFIFLLATAAVEFFVWLGYTISSKVMKNNYELRFEMGETGVNLYQSKRNYEIRKRGYPGKKKFRDVVSEVPFNSVLNIITHPEWDLIDLGVIGGKFQIYVRSEDYELVLNHILDHVPERIRNHFHQ